MVRKLFLPNEGGACKPVNKDDWYALLVAGVICPNTGTIGGSNVASGSGRRHVSEGRTQGRRSAAYLQMLTGGFIPSI